MPLERFATAFSQSLKITFFNASLVIEISISSLITSGRAAGHQTAICSRSHSFSNQSSSVQTILGGEVSTLPAELIQAVAAALQHEGSPAALPLLAIFSSQMPHINMIGTDAPELLYACARRLQAGVVKVRFNSQRGTDELLAAFAASPAAATLRKLDFRQTFITDRSSAQWAAFKSIESIHVEARISMQTLSEILSLQTLRRLNLGDFPVESPVAILEDIIRRKLPLTHLCLAGSEDEIELRVQVFRISELLRANPSFAANLIEFSLFSYEESTNITLDRVLREIRPSVHATKVPSQINSSCYRIGAFLPDVQEDEDSMTTEYLLAVAARLPYLKEMRFVATRWTASDLSCLASLTDLELQLYELKLISTWPPLLKWLSITVTTEEPSWEADQLASSLCQCASLEHVELDIMSHFSRKSAESLLASLPKLRRFYSAGSNYYPQGEGYLRINHPNLEDVPSFSNFDVEIGYMPRLAELPFLGAPASIPSAFVPRVRTATVDIDTLNIPFLKSLKRLRHARFQADFDSTLLPDAVQELTNLRTVTCRGVLNTSSFWDSFFTANRRLTSLDLTFSKTSSSDSAMRDLLFLQRPQPFLSDLRLRGFGDSSPLAPISMSGINLPLLNLVSLHFGDSCPLPALSLDCLPNLYSASFIFRDTRDFAGQETELTSFSVVNCPNLVELSLGYLCFSAFQLENLARIQNISMDRCCWASSLASDNAFNSAVKLQGMPHLCDLMVVYDKVPAHSDGLPDFQGRMSQRVVDLIAKAAPPNLHSEVVDGT